MYDFDRHVLFFLFMLTRSPLALIAYFAWIVYLSFCIKHTESKTGKQPNVSMFSFTATPKPTTLQLFCRLNAKGQKEAFHIYSMKQAIEEGFILDVLQNYITYDTYYQINKTIADDPQYQASETKRQIARFVDLHETNISQRIEIIISLRFYFRMRRSKSSFKAASWYLHRGDIQDLARVRKERMRWIPFPLLNKPLMLSPYPLQNTSFFMRQPRIKARDTYLYC